MLREALGIGIRPAGIAGLAAGGEALLDECKRANLSIHAVRCDGDVAHFSVAR